MILEDQSLIAELMRLEIAKYDDRSVEMFKSASAAKARAQLELPDLAFLDVNLGDHTSFSFAEWLLLQGVEFAFLTSYSKQSLDMLGIPPELDDVQIIGKVKFSQEVKAILGAGPIDFNAQT
ncbi:hypothetical protein JQT98_15850 [Ponticoccus sp. SC6-69]|nr:hypothetical protein [Ponticoccus sp. SC6-38]MBM1244920.1 hypothetical protein [Ponticoccus sp. SC2-64]MBM1249251.1 hypothetical protein [Ponticoccus sp. SC6-42]MBM1253338.1 hypothetical protein [Ponticoccus sp. SC6-33]MBM1258392.1 hypothetical protein [Ponticoccus sp. SC6-60]MBM1267261.1 hypothetical protein [Ponticoccus sp. SC2-67]MBM1271325.1 hypothetical protein [Ponticoccus sp. SC2-37]MBM1276409.1 hypothetical protein [Ponticoccus sp. SC6-56]MBM1284880.1 hypothetical protein [Pontic